MAAWIFVVSVGVALVAHWNSRKHVMFWIAGVVLLLIHIPLVVLLPWPKWNMSGPQFMPFALLDFLGNFALIRWTLMATNRQRHEASRS